jgi:hypothetical protein
MHGIGAGSVPTELAFRQTTNPVPFPSTLVPLAVFLRTATLTIAVRDIVTGFCCESR